MEKFYPKVGDKLYLRQSTGYYYVDYCRSPYTVCMVKGESVYVQECGMKFDNGRYFDSLPTEIFENPKGRIRKLRWSNKHQRWQESPAGSYPEFAVFGEWDYRPYLD